MSATIANDIARPPSRWARRLGGAALFLAPLAVLFVLWPLLIAVFKVDPRVFPGVGAVAQAAVETIRDGSLPAHVAASVWRVLVGTVLGSSSPCRSASPWA